MAKGAGREVKGRRAKEERILARGREKTRSKRPTLIEDPELEEKVLTAQLRQANLYAANILGDGNCLFRALSDQLYGSPSMHLAIRQEVCDYLSVNPDKYRLFVDEDSVKGGFEGHVREMRQPGTYGTNIELSAFVARYRRPVKVYQPNLVYVLPVEESSSSAAGGSAEGSRSPSPPPPPPPAEEEKKLTPRERRLKAREEKENAKGAKGKGKGRLAKEASQAKWKAPEVQPSDAPLCIVYHSWEHYSSLRNLDGPHTGPPRLRVAHVGSPAPSEPSENPDTASTPDPQDDENTFEDEPDTLTLASVTEGEVDEDGDDVDMEIPPLDGEPPTPSSPSSKPALRRTSPAASPSKPLPSVRAALARAKADAAAHPSPSSQARSLAPPPSFSHDLLPPLPPSAASSSPPSPAEPSPRPPKHSLRTASTRPRSASQSTSASSASSGATSPLHPDDADADEDLDENDNDSLSRRIRSRRDSPALSTSTASTGVASASASSSSSQGSAATSTSSPLDAKGADDDEVLPAALPAAEQPTPRAPLRPRRGPTAAEKKEAARQRRVERRRGKAVPAPAAAAGGGRTKEKAGGRVLRSGRKTGDAASIKKEDERALGQLRELFI
ncbi:hypothetical protein JCM10213_008643 [Rhodosporidiobolus nylandii]